MIKKRGLIAIVIFVIAPLALALIKMPNLPSKISSEAISSIFTPSEINVSYVIFIIQWLVLLLIIVIAFMKFLKHMKREKIDPPSSKIIQKKTRSETNLDILYNLLKTKKSLKLKTISKFFKITKEKALEWAKILENHELATIEYPAFTDPEVKINEKENKVKINEKENTKQTQPKEGTAKKSKGSKDRRGKKIEQRKK